MDSTTSDEDDDDLDKALSTRKSISRVRSLDPVVGEYTAAKIPFHFDLIFQSPHTYLHLRDPLVFLLSQPPN